MDLDGILVESYRYSRRFLWTLTRRLSILTLCILMRTLRRKVGLSEYKGQLYVNVREFYADAGGELKHGAKVITISPYADIRANHPNL